jgi:phospholipid/cholesterol/gamma-HCH transport system substrate-binding protein
MSQNRALEIIVGLFICLGVAAVFILTFRVSNLAGGGNIAHGYSVEAQFQNIGGLKVGAPVRMAGVLIGRVSGISINPSNFEAVVNMDISSTYNNLPDDSNASIFTAGLLGEQYIGLTAGGSDQVLKEGSSLKLTQSAFVLEEIIGQFLFNKAEEGSTTTPKAAGTP